MLQPDITKLIQQINLCDTIFYDIETTGVNMFNGQNSIIGFGVLGCKDGEEVFCEYVHSQYWDNKASKLVHTGIDVLPILHAISEKKIICHNSFFDAEFTWREYKVDLWKNLYVDTIILKHTIDENPPFALKDIAKKLFGPDSVSEQKDLKASILANGGHWTTKEKDMYKGDPNLLALYCRKDVKLTKQIFDFYMPRLKAEGLEDFFFKDEVMPLYKTVTRTMQAKGVPIDVHMLRRVEEEILADTAALEARIYEAIKPLTLRVEERVRNKKFPVKRGGTSLFAQAVVVESGLEFPLTKGGKASISKKNLAYMLTCHPENKYVLFLSGQETLSKEEITAIQKKYYKGESFNLRSDDHMGALFFGELREKPTSFTAKGRMSVDVKFLRGIQHKYSWVKDLILFDKLYTKIYTTYIKRFLDKQINGQYYPAFFQHRTTSGRYGSDIQQMPRAIEIHSTSKPTLDHEDLLGYYNNSIRAAIIAKQEDSLVCADFSQLEVMVFADDSQDKKLLEMANKRHDLYSTVAITLDPSLAKDYSADKKAKNYLGKHKKEIRNSRKCFDKDTKVLTDKGYLDIINLKVGDNVLTNSGFKKVTHTNSSTDWVGLFITNKGIIKCTPDHKIWNATKHEWVMAKDFNKGDFLDYNKELKTREGTYQILPIFANAAFKNKASKPLSYLTFDEDWGYILGAYMGDGVGSYTRRKKGINKEGKRCHNSHLISTFVGIVGLVNDEVVDHWTSLVEKFGYKLTKSIRYGEAEAGKDLAQNCVRDFEFVKIFQSTFHAMQWKDELTGKKELKIPEFVLNSPIKVRLAYLAGLLDTDGYLKRHNTRSIVSFCSKDYRLSSDLITLYHSLGVPAVMETSFNKTYRKDYYIVHVNHVGILKLNELGLHNYLVCPRKKEAIKNVEGLSKIRKHMNEYRFNKFIYLAEKCPVYDITVEENHEFYANNIRVHNCLPLGIRYGLESFKLSHDLKISQEEANNIITTFLGPNGYPDLKKRMDEIKNEVILHGKVTSKAGRVRHLPHVKAFVDSYGRESLDPLELYKRYNGTEQYEPLKRLRKKARNGINNALNFPIQSMAASIVNRAAIALQAKFNELGLDAYICLQIHDELVVHCKSKDAELVANLMQTIMETTTKLSVPLEAVPAIGKSYIELK